MILGTDLLDISRLEICYVISHKTCTEWKSLLPNFRCMVCMMQMSHFQVISKVYLLNITKMIVPLLFTDDSK